MTTHRKRFQWSLWGAPIALALVTAIGLIAALVGDGAWDAASWIALGLPVAVCAWFGLRRAPAGQAASGRRTTARKP